MEDQKLNKIEINIVNEQTKPSLEFKEPEWMKILKTLLADNPQLNEKLTMVKNHSIMVENG